MARLFLHGSYLPGGADHTWIADRPWEFGLVRARRWRYGRGGRVLVPSPGDQRVKGVVVDVDEAHQRVIELLERSGAGPLERAPGGEGPRWLLAAADVHLRPVQVLAWGFPDARTASIAGARPPPGERRWGWADDAVRRWQP